MTYAQPNENWVPVARMAIAFAALAAVSLLATGCAGLGHKMRSMVAGEDATRERTVGTRFSEQDSVKANSDRRYQRMTRKKFEEEASLGADAGSLWVMEGQGGYLFAQNQTRMVGDLLNVKIEGAPKSQLQTKARVISKLLERLERPEFRGPASQAANPGAQPGANGATPGAAAAAAPPVPAPPAAAAATAAEASKAETSLAPQVVPTRIVEILKDGSYRVKGSQPFMIGKREYKTIVTGVVRSEDFDETGVDAAKLLDSQFDIVGSRKGMGI